jgi:RNA polymerase sigma factor (sigma-70 family)
MVGGQKRECDMENVGSSEENMVDTGIYFESVYDELKRIAEGRLRALPSGRTLHATLLVHEAFLRLMVSQNIVCSPQIASNDSFSNLGSSYGESISPAKWASRAAFFAASSEAMRRIIIDHYRRKVAQKRGGRFRRLPIEPGQLPCETKGRDLLEIEDALKEFEAAYPEKAQLVKMRFFLGMTMTEAAEALETSVATAERHWRFARAWIADFLKKS